MSPDTGLSVVGMNYHDMSKPFSSNEIQSLATTVPVLQVDPRTRVRDYPTIADVARDFHCSDQTVRRWIREGKLRAYRFGPRRVLIDPVSVAALVSFR